MAFFKDIFCGRGHGQPSQLTPIDPAAAPEGTRVADADTLPEGGRLHLKLEGRYVSLVRHNGKVTCIDSICFHAGGPLGLGDIEDIDGNPCLVCPWHYYKIDMFTGDKYYQEVKFIDGKMVPGAWTSNGRKQRVFPVTEAGGGIYVKLDAVGAVESDDYSRNVTCGERVLSGVSKQGMKTHATVGGDGKKPSGAVLQQARAAAAASAAGSTAGCSGASSTSPSSGSAAK